MKGVYLELNLSFVYLTADNPANESISYIILPIRICFEVVFSKGNLEWTLVPKGIKNLTKELEGVLLLFDEGSLYVSPKHCMSFVKKSGII